MIYLILNKGLNMFLVP